jgi:hypothetical protein
VGSAALSFLPKLPWQQQVRFIGSSDGAGNGENTSAFKALEYMMNSKTDTASNTQKNPDDWVSGDEPMTGAQASYLKTLCEQAHRPDAFKNDLTKAEASKLIDAMRKEAGVTQER